jgi:hypothetical protein
VRAHDWPQRLDAYIESRRSAPFVYGEHDCCRFADGAVVAMTGETRMRQYGYASRIAAARLIVDGGGLDQLLTLALGDPVHPSEARRGDVVVADLEEGPTAGVCLGDACAFAAAPEGVTFRPRVMMRLAWRID